MNRLIQESFLSGPQFFCSNFATGTLHGKKPYGKKSSREPNIKNIEIADTELK